MSARSDRPRLIFFLRLPAYWGDALMIPLAQSLVFHPGAVCAVCVERFCGFASRMQQHHDSTSRLSAGSITARVQRERVGLIFLLAQQETPGGATPSTLHTGGVWRVFERQLRGSKASSPAARSFNWFPSSFVLLSREVAASMRQSRR